MCGFLICGCVYVWACSELVYVYLLIVMRGSVYIWFLRCLSVCMFGF